MNSIGKKRTIKPPKNFKSTEIVHFLDSCEEIFNLKEAEEEGFFLDLSNVTRTSMLAALIVYKFIEFSSNHRCFKNPVINLPRYSQMSLALEKYGFTDLVRAFVEDRGSIKSEYEKLSVSFSDSFIIAPQALVRNNRRSREEINNKYLPQIQKYYRGNPKAISMILLVFSEILLNFWEHAIEDTESIIVAHGNSQNIEIACADTGNGIISTLGGSMISESLRPEQILLESLKRGVTSKKMTNHMGYGLWILDQITTMVKGRLHIYSQGAYYYNEYGAKRSGRCGYWQGTIVYISLPLQKPKTLVDIEPLSSSEIKINWI